MPNEVEFLRAADVAPMLGVTTRRVHQLARAGRIPVVREGRAVLIPRRAWEQWLDLRADEALAAVQDPRT
jgi:excisionase family DNA binding protein